MRRLRHRWIRVGCASLCVALVCSLIAGIGTLSTASATPELLPVSTATPVETRMGADRASLEASSTSILVDDPFGYTARAVLSSPADYVRFRLKIWRPTGRLIFQRTRLFNEASAGPVSASFWRETSDLGLHPGVYPVELSVSIARKGTTNTSVLPTRLIVYEEGASVPVALVARVTGQPLSDPNGRFITDPGTSTRARDDVDALCSWVLATQNARVTLSLSPLLLEEWQRITAGYELVGPEGTQQIAAEDAVPKAYAATLTLLRDAIATNRLEVVSSGYSDPDLSDLEGAGLLDDVTPQYDRGLSIAYTSLETTPSTGTVVPGGRVPAAAVPLLRKAGVRYTVVDPSSTRRGKARAAASAYRLASDGLVVLVSDRATSKALSSGDSSAVASLAFARLVDQGVSGPLVLRADLGAGGTDVSALTATYDALARQPWIDVRLAREVASAPAKRTVRLVSGNDSSNDPAGYWSDVKDARDWSQALAAAIGDGSTLAETAGRDSLIAECSAWAGADGSWALEDRGRTFSAASKRLSSGVLGKVSLAIEPVTLAGTSGKVPVTIRNRSGRTLKLHLKLGSGAGVHLTSPRDRIIEIGPKETFAEVPVALTNVLSGDVRVSIASGGVTLTEASVTVRASYLDRIALVCGVVLLMIALLVFIRRRATAVEQ